MDDIIAAATNEAIRAVREGLKAALKFAKKYKSFEHSGCLCGGNMIFGGPHETCEVCEETHKKFMEKQNRFRGKTFEEIAEIVKNEPPVDYNVSVKIKKEQFYD